MNLYLLTIVLLVIVVSTQDIDSEVPLHLGFQVSRKDPTTEVIYIYLSFSWHLLLSTVLHEEISSYSF